ncbi:MAG: hypothetical protein P8X74_13380 [Reinekea sp.]
MACALRRYGVTDSGPVLRKPLQMFTARRSLKAMASPLSRVH